MASLSLGNVPDDPVPDLEPFDIKATLRRMDEIRAGLRAAAAAEGRPILEVPSLPPMTEQEKAAEGELLAHLRSHFKGRHSPAKRSSLRSGARAIRLNWIASATASTLPPDAGRRYQCAASAAPRCSDSAGFIAAVLRHCPIVRLRRSTGRMEQRC